MTKTILLIDDEEDVRGLVDLMLAKEDFRLLSAQTGNEALRMVQEESVDLILLDLMMPGMSGQDFLRIIKRMPSTKALPVVVLTAVEEKESMEECLDLGAIGYVQKPFAKKILVRTIKNVLGLQDEPVQRVSENRPKKASA